ncbi:MAG: phosphoribosylanthranilate isomerase [Bacteroidota bacterium]
MTVPRVKVCCIGSVEEARLAIEHGASALGLVSAMPSGPGVIGEDLIAEIAASVPPPVATFLLTSSTDAEKIAAQAKRCQVNTLQLVDSVETTTYTYLRADLPTIKLVQVIHVESEANVEEAVRVGPHVDALLLDSGRPTAALPELGGTGRTHDWSLSRRIVETVDVPVFLAGGLSAANVAEAIRAVRPFGVDLCSGVRTADRLDAEKLASFFVSVAKAALAG